MFSLQILSIEPSKAYDWSARSRAAQGIQLHVLVRATLSDVISRSLLHSKCLDKQVPLGPCCPCKELTDNLLARAKIMSRAIGNHGLPSTELRTTSLDMSRPTNGPSRSASFLDNSYTLSCTTCRPITFPNLIIIASLAMAPVLIPRFFSLRQDGPRNPLAILACA